MDVNSEDGGGGASNRWFSSSKNAVGAQCSNVSPAVIILQGIQFNGNARYLSNNSCFFPTGGKVFWLNAKPKFKHKMTCCLWLVRSFSMECLRLGCPSCKQNIQQATTNSMPIVPKLK